MASTLITLLTLSILAFSASARPCKTLFISSYFVSLRRFPSPSGFVTVVTEIRQLHPIRFFNNDDSTPVDHHHHHAVDVNVDVEPLKTRDLSSLRDRTKDILSVVVALLFGVGCGALTAATMYLAWSLFSSSRHSFDDEEDDVSPKKMGYVMIPEAVKPPKEEVAAAGAV